MVRDGKLLQMDTPDAIYNRPADLFVANFTGATNELAGTLVSRNGKFGTIDFGEGRRGEVALLHSLGPDEKVRVALRPENITIGQHNGDNIFPARILDRRYQGTQTAYGIELFGRRLEAVELGTAAEIEPAIKEWREAITLKLPGGNDAEESLAVERDVVGSLETRAAIGEHSRHEHRVAEGEGRPRRHARADHDDR